MRAFILIQTSQSSAQTPVFGGTRAGIPSTADQVGTRPVATSLPVPILPPERGSTRERNFGLKPEPGQSQNSSRTCSRKAASFPAQPVLFGRDLFGYPSLPTAVNGVLPLRDYGISVSRLLDSTEVVLIIRFPPNVRLR